MNTIETGTKAIMEKMVTKALAKKLKLFTSVVKKNEENLINAGANLVGNILTNEFFENHLKNVRITNTFIDYDTLVDTMGDLELEDAELGVATRVVFSIDTGVYDLTIWSRIKDDMNIYNSDYTLYCVDDTLNEDFQMDVGGKTIIPELLQIIKEFQGNCEAKK